MHPDSQPDTPTADAALPPDPEQDGALKPSGLQFAVVGIGASAGGTQALTRFFQSMPPDSGMGFVVVMHLSPSHASHLSDILGRVTTMPVSEVTEAVAIEANHVYVIPPGRMLWMDDGHLHLRDEQRLAGRNVAIDSFFRVLAQVHRQRAIAVVLSGTGTDGAVGLKRIKELGGVTLAQSPDDAEHRGMPEAALATGLVDFVLAAAAMPQKLLQLAANAQAIRLPVDPPDELRSQAVAGVEEENQAEAAMNEIMSLLRKRTHHDFSHYKRPTVLRRLERRLQVTATPSLPAYRDHLLEHPEETPALLQDMLISVTNFFRDREAFEALERDVLPHLHPAAKGDSGLRVWVVGCASGEEAYSLAMLLQEDRDRRGESAPFQVFASDIDTRALATARAGLYPGSIAADVSPARLRQFFVAEGDHFRVKKSLRERVLFAHHNVLREPPFSRVDLISCRNLLIYLNRGAQATVLATFRFALRPGGALFLGSSESTDVAGDDFAVIDKKHRLYRVHSPEPRQRVPAPLLEALPSGSTLLPPEGPSTRRIANAELHQRAILAWARPSVLVDSHNNILHLSEGASRFLQMREGVPTHNLLDNAHPDLRLDLRAALFRARPMTHGDEAGAVEMESRLHDERVRILVQPVRDARDEREMLRVAFEALGPLPAAAGDARATGDGQTEEAMRRLELENQRLQRHLQEVIEHSEASTEELMASNEELQALNEELRSASEELETSREELQSTNEELTTVNAQLAQKVDETSRINDDLQNLIDSNDIATVFVDRRMHIHRYTPRATELFNLIKSDIGRPLMDITHRLDYPQLVDDARTAFQTLRLVEREVTASGDRHFVVRMLPFRTAEDKIEGAILSFVEVTLLRRSQRDERAGAERLRLAVESTRDFAILTLDANGLITSWNPGAARLFGYEEAEIIGQPLALVFTEDDRAAGVPERELATAGEHGRAEDERWHRRKDGSVFFCSGVTTRLHDGGFAKIARDLTGSKQAALARERQLSHAQAGRRQAEATMEAKELFLAVMSHELKHPLNLIHMNAELLARMPEIRVVPAAARAADIIQQTVAGQARIIDDLLDLSRVRTGKLRLEQAVVDWSVVVQRIGQALRSEADAKGVSLQLGACSGEALTLFDPVRADQVVWNLLSNALKFTPSGGSVRVVLDIERDFVRLTVTDSGRGIAPEFIDSVFDMFSQEGSAARQDGDGLGIGLALVRELVHAHGGRVQARSEGLDRGAEFSVWIPLHRQVEEPSATSPTASVLRGMRLLVVDDSVDSVESFAMLLRLAGAVVTTASDGNAALAAMDREHFDLLISDISMPGMSGHDLIRAVRARPDGAALLALACSGYSRAQDQKRALEVGFNALIGKPAALEQVERTVTLLRRPRP
jgi:two-component system, chemotaxis family, CheB/CheR fusion protein